MASRLIICVIEPHAAQFVGAVMQRESMLAQLGPVDYQLLIVRRGGLESRIIALAEQIGISVSALDASAVGRYFNKWEAIARVDSSEDVVVLIDWDIIAVRQAAWPPIACGGVAYRANDWKLHEAALGLLGGDWNLTKPPMNSGVVWGDLASMRTLAVNTLRIGTEMSSSFSETPLPDWEHEQLSASLAVMALKTMHLPSEWNATPTGVADDQETVLWHYNDGHSVTRQLKAELLIPSRVHEACEKLSIDWPRSIAAMHNMYKRAMDYSSVRSLLREPISRD